MDLDFGYWPKPKSYVEHYDSAITAFQMEVRDEIELEFSDFQRYVMDNWEWRGAFVGTTSNYVS